MLNLETLEQQLDRALSKENYKTMTSWLINKRMKINYG